MKHIYLAIMILVVVSGCKKEDGTAVISAGFTYPEVTHGIPYTIGFINNSSANGGDFITYYWYQKRFGDNEQYKGGDEHLSLLVEEEGYHIVRLEASVSTSGTTVTDTHSDTITIYGNEYLEATILDESDISTCESFNYDGITFDFGQSNNDNVYDGNPGFHPVGDSDIGNTLYFLGADINKQTRFTEVNGVISGEGIWDMDIEMLTEKVDLDFHNKFYIQIEEGCIAEVRAFTFTAED